MGLAYRNELPGPSLTPGDSIHRARFGHPNEKNDIDSLCMASSNGMPCGAPKRTRSSDPSLWIASTNPSGLSLPKSAVPVLEKMIRFAPLQSSALCHTKSLMPPRSSIAPRSPEPTKARTGRSRRAIPHATSTLAAAPMDTQSTTQAETRTARRTTVERFTPHPRHEPSRRVHTQGRPSRSPDRLGRSRMRGRDRARRAFAQCSA